MVNQLSESQLMKVAEYIIKLKQADEEGFSEGEKRSQRPEADPILDVIGTIDAEPFAEDIDGTVIGMSYALRHRKI
jgi:hypothetical protein